MKLYEITNAIIDSQHDEVNMDDLNALQIAFDDKVIACACVVKNLNAEVAAVDSEIQRLTKRKRQIETNRDNLKNYVLKAMQAANVDKVENGVHRIRRQKSPLSVQITDQDAVPVQFKIEVIEIKVDRKAIADWVKDTGEIVDGVDVHQNEHLRIS